MHVVSGVLLITSVLAVCHFIGKELYEFLAVTKVDGLPPAPSITGLVGPKHLGGSFATNGSVENYVLEI